MKPTSQQLLSWEISLLNFSYQTTNWRSAWTSRSWQSGWHQTESRQELDFSFLLLLPRLRQKLRFRNSISLLMRELSVMIKRLFLLQFNSTKRLYILWKWVDQVVQRWADPFLLREQGHNTHRMWDSSMVSFWLLREIHSKWRRNTEDFRETPLHHIRMVWRRCWIWSFTIYHHVADERGNTCYIHFKARRIFIQE